MDNSYTLQVDEYPVYVKIIDSTHVSIVYLYPEHENSFTIYHIAQLDPDETLGREVLSVINEYKKGESK